MINFYLLQIPMTLNWFLSKKLCDLYKYCIIHKISVITFPEIFDGTFSFAW